MATIKVTDLTGKAVGRHLHLDPERVRRYRRVLDQVPPVVVFETSEGPLLADGYHRLEAAIQEGRDTIEAEIRVGSKHDAFEYAIAVAAEERGIDPEVIRAHLLYRYKKAPPPVGGRLRERIDLLLSLTESDEKVLAEGGATVSDHLVDDRLLQSGAAGSAIVVTDRRIRWTGGYREAAVRSLAFDSVSASAEVRYVHRFGLQLDHDPVERIVWVPAHRFLWWRWGNAEAVRSIPATLFVFNGQNTKAAVALREQLRRWRVPSKGSRVIPKVERNPRRTALARKS
ncbi:MAG TPA: hypothetical protein VKA30_00320 [Actinomycetota bacterium]|nr:hypothetical protein [Actinomycetota bacterium]